MTKPKITKSPEGSYVCEIPIEIEPEDGCPEEVWYRWSACGVGDTPVEAYKDWIKDWEKYV